MKTTKRRKVWVTFFDDGEHFAFDTCREAKSYAGPFGSERQAVAMVELRKGEAIVDVEALVAEFATRWENSDPSGAYDALRAALRKVGKR